MPNNEIQQCPPATEALTRAIRNYGMLVSRKTEPEYKEVTVCLKLDHAPVDLMDALSQGVAYQIKDEKVYIWYAAKNGAKENLNESAFMQLVGYKLPRNGDYFENMVTFILAPDKRL